MRSGFARNSFFSSVAGLSTILGSFLSSIVVARLLGVEGMGSVAYAVWLATMLVVICDGGLAATIARFIPELQGSGHTADAIKLTSYLCRRLILGCLFAATIIIGVAWARPVASLNPEMTLLVGGLACLQMLANFTIGYYRGCQRFSTVAAFTAASFVFQLPAIAIGATLYGPPGAVFGYLFGAIIPALAVAPLLRSGGLPTSETRQRSKKYSVYAWAAAIASALVWSRIEIFFLDRSWGPESVGLFTAGMTLSSLATQGPMLLTGALLGYFSQRVGQNALAEVRTAYATATRVMAFFVFPACFGLAAIMPAVLKLLYGDAFEAAAPAATILVSASAFGAAAAVGTNLVFAMERSDFVFRSGLFGAVLSVLVGFLIIPHYGLVGAAVGRAAVQITMVALGLWFISRRLAFPTPFRDLLLLMTCGLFCAFIAHLTLTLFQSREAIGLPAAIATGALAYLLAVRSIGALPRKDVERLRDVLGALHPIASVASKHLVFLLAR